MKKTIITIAVLLFAALLFTGAAAAVGPMVGGDSGTIHIHTNVPGAKVSFYLIDGISSGQPVDIRYADASGDVFIRVYTTATPPRYAVVTAPGYIQDVSSQVTLAVPAPGETLRYDIPLTPIGQTPVPTATPTPQPTPVPYISGLLPLPVQPVRGGA